MATTFSVAISYNNALGWIDYDADARKAEVHLSDDEGKKLTEDYLRTTHEINIPHETLMDFTHETIDPLADENSFKLALTRLWNETKVHVDWSRPVDYVKQHPHY
ncbi:hypothetical protein SAMN02910356_01608 [Selenomonas sp. GACV-9]|uniref:hypothetical protein n=1 Tax=Selenomonas sp. GACV-9 TaxID=3158782 RepID=UPI0008EB805F|nr:hypothetical protein SAMN02910356_01608 [Selenomonas ruminantium]